MNALMFDSSTYLRRDSTHSEAVRPEHKLRATRRESRTSQGTHALMNIEETLLPTQCDDHQVDHTDGWT